jgi:hypothetical protein
VYSLWLKVHFLRQTVNSFGFNNNIFIIWQAVQCFHIFLRPFDNYIIFSLQLLLSFQASSINPFSPTSPLIPSAQVSLGLLYDFSGVIPRRLNFICRRFGSLCLFHLHRQVGVCGKSTHTYLPMKMEQSVPKRRHMKFRRRGFTQKKSYNVQNTAKV